jgi:type I restriction enzyme S subunit
LRACQVPPLQQKAITVVDIAIVRPGINSVDPRWLMHAINSPVMRETIAIQSTGTTRRRIARGKLADLQFPLPPCNEQKRIAAKLDTTLAAVDACRQRLDGVAAILKRFRQAVLAAATSGELTREWREERGINKDWKPGILDDIASIQGGITKDSKKQLDEYPEFPYLRVANVQRGYLDLSEISFIRVPPGKIDSLLLEEGDILFNEGGDRDKVGRGWIWEGQIDQCVFQNHVFRARLLSPEDQPKFVSWWSNTRGADHFLGEGKQTTNLASISKKTLGQLPIQMPSPAEQSEIIDRVEALFSLADQLEARLTSARRIVERLTPALLAKAFRGELVPQDPNDEPASVLLERIRVARQEDAASGMPKRPRRRNAQTPRSNPKTFTNMLTRKDVPQNHLSAILLECGPLSAEALWSASQLEIDDFYDQLRDEEAQGLLRENRGASPTSPRLLEPAA